MSIRNQKTGRHEEDLYVEAVQNGGSVTIAHLLEHAEEIIAQTPEAYGMTASAVARALATLVEETGMDRSRRVQIFEVPERR